MALRLAAPTSSDDVASTFGDPMEIGGADSGTKEPADNGAGVRVHAANSESRPKPPAADRICRRVRGLPAHARSSVMGFRVSSVVDMTAPLAAIGWPEDVVPVLRLRFVQSDHPPVP